MPRRFAPLPLVLAVVATVAVVVARIGVGDAFPAWGGAGAPGACHDPVTEIHEVQGTAAASPLEGEVVTIEAIVTATYQGHEAPIPFDLGSYAVQTPAERHDDDPRTSEGVLVVDARPVEVGQLVRLRGTVRERHGRTEIADVIAVRVCDDGLEVAPVPLPFPLDDAAFASLEAMLVTVPDGVIAGTDAYARYGELWIAAAEAVPLAPTHAHPPGPEAAAADRAQRANRVLYDDGRDAQNPSPPRHPDGRPLDREHRFRVGDRVHDLHGVVVHAFDAYRLHPAGPPPRIEASAPRPEAPEPVGGDLRVAAMNLENWFVTMGDACGPNRDRTCRGARNEEERDRQAAKLTAALAGLDADVIALIELENRADDAAAHALAEALNERLAREERDDRYAAVPVGRVGTDLIAQGFLLREGAVRAEGPAIVLDAPDFVDPHRHGRGGNRPAVGQRFVPVGDGSGRGGEPFAVVALHLRSKGAPCGPGDDDPLQGSCAATRSAAAEVLARDLEARADRYGERVLIVGDLNAHPREDAAERLRAGPDGALGSDDDLIDLIARHAGPDAASYLFDGRAARLDHAFATPTLAADVTGATLWSVNAREPSLFDASTRFKAPRERELFAPDPYRSSDHDPLLIGIRH